MKTKCVVLVPLLLMTVLFLALGCGESKGNQRIFESKTLDILYGSMLRWAKAQHLKHQIHFRPPVKNEKLPLETLLLTDISSELTLRLELKKENVYFTNKKAQRIRELDIEIFYGDSDSDIKAAQDAGIEGISILRSPKSSYKKKYNPGKYGEKIIPNSEE